MVKIKDRTPNQEIMPVSATVVGNELYLGGLPATSLAEKFGTPLWVICQETIEESAAAIKEGLAKYPGKTAPCYAGKAFLCTAMVKLIEKLGLGLDVVSEGELRTALQADFPAEKIYLHGNNKTDAELLLVIDSGANLVVDSKAELLDLIELARNKGKLTKVLLRIIPGIDVDTHEHIKTGHLTSKFGIPLAEIEEVIALCLQNKSSIDLHGIHAHLGSQAMELGPFLEAVDIYADLYKSISEKFGYTMPHLDVGGGLGIAYTQEDKPISLTEWAQGIAARVEKCFGARDLPLPVLAVEPGRSLVGPAGVTLYRVGRTKVLPEGTRYLMVDGGMADNPRPITYQAAYTAAVANRMESREGQVKDWSIVGRYCESGDIIVNETRLDAGKGDLIAVFATGAYNYSQSSNYNRTARPACILVKDGSAEVILVRETCQDLLRQDRLPSWLS